MSSGTMLRVASLWPAAVSRSASVVPDLSSSSERVSDTVSTAMFSGTNCLAWSAIGHTLTSRTPGANVLQAWIEPD